MQSNCVFCKIIAGEIPSTTVYEDGDFKAIMDISPAAKGHIIILPKKHCDNLFELEEQLASKVLVVARKLAIAIKEQNGCEGVNILQNNGEAAGQTVFHYHMHIIPRYKEDQVRIEWMHRKYEEGEAASLAAAIAKRL